MAEQKIKSLNVILKADVQGSLEALLKEIEKLENDEVPVRVLLKGVGGITESDVMLADASEAIVIGFRVAPEDRAVTLAEEKAIEIRRYDIIYQVSDEIKQAIEGRLEPEIKEVHLGRAVVRQVFKISRGGAGTVAGCFVTQGVIERNAQARIIREGREIYKGPDRGAQALQGRRPRGPRELRVRHQDRQVRRHQGRRRDRGLPHRGHPPDPLTRRPRPLGGRAPTRRGPADAGPAAGGAEPRACPPDHPALRGPLPCPRTASSA